MAKETAEKRYTETRTRVLAMLAAITAKITANEIPADRANWADLGEMAGYREALQDLHDRLHGTGEYAG